MLTFVMSECDGALYACQSSSFPFPLLSPAGLVSDRMFDEHTAQTFHYLYAKLHLIKALACMKYELVDFGPEECNANSVSVPQTALLSTLLMFSSDSSVLCSK